ncbi:unnamed protein product [marine sediment metagenome]|uniref:Uncharacterized protein n=1 Tax=marine sediment metagenome TaxID=412755 RepID=X1QW46_9ZZZZ
MTPKQYIKYTQRLDKKGLAICDGSTVEPIQSLGSIFNLFLVVGGFMGVYYFGKWLIFDRKK